MATADADHINVGEVALRAENVDRMVKGIAVRNAVLKGQVVATVNSNAWEETYYRESVLALGGKKGIPRLAAFPSDSVVWDKVTNRQQKFGLEASISWEDVSTNRIDVISRTLFRIGNRIASLVDTHIWDTISESVTPTDIHTVATSAEWNNATRGNRIPHEDIAEAASLLADSELQAYKADTILVNPDDFIYLITNDYIMDSFDASSPSLMRSGNMGTLFGMKIVQTPVVTDDKAMVCQSKVCASYKQADSLKTVSIKKEGMEHIIRGWEIGVCQLTDPKAVCLITNTHA